MRRLLLFILLFISVMACERTSATQEAAIELGAGMKSEIVLDADGDIVNLRFTSAKDWHVESDDAQWLEISPLEGTAGKGLVKVKADENTTLETRTAIVNLCSEDVVLPISLSQDAYVPTFELLETEKVVSCLGGEVVIKVYTDTDFEYDCEADWIHLPQTKAPRTKEVRVTVDPNQSPEERTAVITFCSGMVCRAYTLTQRPVGTEADDWKYGSFVHRSLAMRFTATWCGYCPMMGIAFDSAKSQMSGGLELLCLHGSQSDLYFVSSDTYQTRFKVTGFPTGVVDARASIPNYDPTSYTASLAVNVAKETQAAFPSKTGIALSSSLDGNNLTVDVSLYFKEADSYRVTVLLLEDGIVGYQNGGGSNYTHNDVARLAVSSVNGEDVVVEDATVWTKTYSATVDSGWDPAKMKVLVYVEKPYGDQTKVKGVENATYGNYGDTYIDNCRAAKVGETAELELK